ncbi:MAG: hypothetical protein ACE5HX_08745 [bacterium]
MEHGDCNFWAKYSQQSTVHFQTQTVVHSNWGISAGLTCGFEVLDNGIEASMKASYGEGFSRDVKIGHTAIVGFDIETIKDDQIFGTILLGEEK